jgi:hypothetical protein
MKKIYLTLLCFSCSLAFNASILAGDVSYNSLDNKQDNNIPGSYSNTYESNGVIITENYYNNKLSGVMKTVRQPDGTNFQQFQSYTAGKVDGEPTYTSMSDKGIVSYPKTLDSNIQTKLNQTPIRVTTQAGNTGGTTINGLPPASVTPSISQQNPAGSPQPAGSPPPSISQPNLPVLTAPSQYNSSPLPPPVPVNTGSGLKPAASPTPSQNSGAVGASTISGLTTGTENNFTVKNTDGSYSTTVKDTNGKFTTTMFDNTGKQINNQYTNTPPTQNNIIGSQGGSPAPSVRNLTTGTENNFTVKNTDGSYSTTVKDANGKPTTTMFDKDGKQINNQYTNTPPTQNNIIGSQGGSPAPSVRNLTTGTENNFTVKNTDGSYSTTVKDANGKPTTTMFDKNGKQINNQYTNTPPTQNNIIGSQSGSPAPSVRNLTTGTENNFTVKNTDGSYSTTVKDANGKPTTTMFDKNGKQINNQYTNPPTTAGTGRTGTTGALAGSPRVGSTPTATNMPGSAAGTKVQSCPNGQKLIKGFCASNKQEAAAMAKASTPPRAVAPMPAPVQRNAAEIAKEKAQMQVQQQKAAAAPARPNPVVSTQNLTQNNANSAKYQQAKAANDQAARDKIAMDKAAKNKKK